MASPPAGDEVSQEKSAPLQSGDVGTTLPNDSKKSISKESRDSKTAASEDVLETTPSIEQPTSYRLYKARFAGLVGLVSGFWSVVYIVTKRLIRFCVGLVKHCGRNGLAMVRSNLEQQSVDMFTLSIVLTY